MCLNSQPFRPFVICPKYEEIWKKEEEEKKLLEERKRKSVTMQEIENNSIRNKDIEEEINLKLKPKTYQNKKLKNHFFNNTKSNINNKIEINEFLKEFEGYNMLETFEERKYFVPSSININEVNLFFTRIKENQKYYQFN